MGRPRSDHHEPTVHWVLLGAVMLVLVAALLISGVVNGQVGEGAQTPLSQAGTEPVPPAVRSGGPVIDPNTPAEPGLFIPRPTRRAHLRRRTHALDCRHPRRAAAPRCSGHLLRRGRPSRRPTRPATADVPGGSRGGGAHLQPREPRQRVAPAPADRARPDPAQHRRRDRSRDQPAPSSLLLAGRRREPSEWQAVASARGYRIVYTDLDTRDWARPGVDSIVDAGTPQGDRGAVIMLHDGGGDRVRPSALDLLITRLQARGYTFEVTSAVGLSSAWHRHDVRPAAGRLVGAAVSGAALAVDLIQFLFILLAVLAVLRILLLVALARRHDRRSAAAARPVGSCHRSRSSSPRTTRKSASRRPSVRCRPATIPVWRSSSSTTVPPTPPQRWCGPRLDSVRLIRRPTPASRRR